MATGSVLNEKVRSNEQLIKLLGTETLKDHFFDSMVDHIRERGLTFNEREFVTQVIDRVIRTHGI